MLVPSLPFVLWTPVEINPFVIAIKIPKCQAQDPKSQFVIVAEAMYPGEKSSLTIPWLCLKDPIMLHCLKTNEL